MGKLGFIRLCIPLAHGASYSFMYRIGHLTGAQIRQRIDKGLAEILAQPSQSAAHRMPLGKAMEEFVAGVVAEES